MSGLRIALDARLAGGQSTGDSTYWTGLLHGFSSLTESFQLLLFSNAPRPANIPNDPRFSWIALPSRSDRWWSLVTLPLAARKHGAQALHVQYSLSPLEKSGITTVHDVSFFVGPEWFPARHRLLLQKTVPSSVKRAKRVITVSETSRAEIEKWIPVAIGKVDVSYPAGHPLIRRVERAAARAMVLQGLNIQQPFALTVGTRWPRKNMGLALEAMDLLPPDLPHVLAVTGKEGWGDERPSKRACFTGYLSFDLLSALYSAAELYLAPSRHEGFGIPVVEAFNCGCPVLSSAGGALPEVVGDAGVVQPSWDPNDWAGSLESLLTDSSNLDSMRERGFERAKKFSWQETARKTLDVYKRVAQIR